MSSISFKLEAFEGPLDLLLHLIQKHKLNIYDIEISLLLEQYLDYIEGLKEQDFEAAGEFLEMAARLIYIKTVSLLPKPNESQELKKELEGRLIEYSMCKRAAKLLQVKCAYGEIYVRPPTKLPVDKTYKKLHDKEILLDTYIALEVRRDESGTDNTAVFKPIVSKKIVSVTSKIIFVLKKLYITGKCTMSAVFDSMTDKSERIATFLAILELTKSGRIWLNDDNTEMTFNREHSKRKAAEGEV
ncbi:MAG: segregation/condensation protein A [Ruminococcus sp.]|nr:segregation/condensation protein A [Ruminococcus sp.]